MIPGYTCKEMKQGREGSQSGASYGANYHCEEVEPNFIGETLRVSRNTHF